MSIALRPRDLVRRSPAIPLNQGQACNLHHLGWPHYHWAWIVGGNLFYARADGTTPPSVVQVQITTAGLSAWPHVARDNRARLWLVWQEGQAILRSYSDDDGSTWSTAETMFTNGKYPRIAIHPTRGTMIVAAWVANRIRARRQYPGETMLGAEYVLTEAGGAEIAVADDGFDLSPAIEGPSRWLLIAKRQGQAHFTHWVSADDGVTWEAL